MSSTSNKFLNGSSSGSEEQITSDWRIQGYKPLIPPQILEMEIPMSDNARRVVSKAREECVNVLNRTDDRLLVVVGPCSIHDTFSAVEYAKKLKELNEELKGELLIIMRAYFEKPRTTVGWKGLINDPDLNESYQINKGLRVGRQLLQDLNELGVPVGGELLDTITPQFLGEFFSWGAIGARTTESQLHRELASGVSFPVGFKNGTDGNAKIAIDAIKAASHPHHFLGITHQGLASISVTKGNEDCHIILRGGNAGPNYEKQYVDKITEELTNAKLTPNIMVDCSHGNSRKKHENQILVAKDLEEQISNGNKDIVGVMIESNLKAGRQDLPPQGAEGLKFGVSITDACIAWDDTVSVLKGLAEAIKVRRSKSNQ